MKQKSLRQMAKELGVSHSYLSQVKNGKRPASQKVVSMVSKTTSEEGTSNPLGGIKALGGFDSHALPPEICYFHGVTSPDSMLQGTQGTSPW